MQIPRGHKKSLLKFARDMRSKPTDAERKLWQILRMKQLSGYRFRRQQRVGNYILDFYCATKRLCIELDGGQHADPEIAAHDNRRTEYLNQLGVHVLRFWDNDVLKNPEIVADDILKHLELPPPRPSPGVPGEEEGAS